MAAWMSLPPLSLFLLFAGLVGAACTAPAAATASTGEPVSGAEAALDDVAFCSDHRGPGGYRDLAGYEYCASRCELAYVYCTHGIGGPSRPQDPVLCAQKRGACCDDCEGYYRR
jgi:hypothetical protein